VTVEAANAGADRLHEGELRRLGAKRTDNARGGGTLHGEERALGRGQKLHARRKAAGDVRVVDVLARGVDDEHQAAVAAEAGGPRHHQVVDDAARIGEELAVALAAGGESDDVGGNEGLERGGRRCMIGAGEHCLAHVRDVEQAGLRARCQMLLEDAEGVLNGHLVTRERHHLGAERDVLRVEGRALQGRVGSRIGTHLVEPLEVPQGLHPAPGWREFKPPLSRDLRDFSVRVYCPAALPLR